MKLKVSVKRKHINEGLCENPTQCAVAKAILDIKGVTEVSVCGNLYADIVLLYKGKEYIHKVINRSLDKFIERFDDLAAIRDDMMEQLKARKKLKPFTFTLNLKKAEEF